jgi:hypothetical protein
VACAWAKVTFVEAMCDVVCNQTLRWPGIRLNVHVGDATASCVGSRRSGVVCALSETMAEVGALVDIEIRGLVALPTCFVACSEARGGARRQPWRGRFTPAAIGRGKLWRGRFTLPAMPPPAIAR